MNSGGYLSIRFGEVNIHSYSPTLRRIIVLVYTTQVYSNSQTITLLSDEIGFARHFFLRKPSGREYHLTSRDWGANQIARKVFTCVVYTNCSYRVSPNGSLASPISIIAISFCQGTHRASRVQGFQHGLAAFFPGNTFNKNKPKQHLTTSLKISHDVVRCSNLKFVMASQTKPYEKARSTVNCKKVQQFSSEKSTLYLFALPCSM